MALRAETAAGAGEKSALAGVKSFWPEASTPPQLEWKKWLDLFAVACVAKYSISLHELTRAEPPARDVALMGNLVHGPACRKVVSVLFLSLGEAGRKTLMDKNPALLVAEVLLDDLLLMCQEAFEKAQNLTLDRHRFLSRKQGRDESLQQFWNALNGKRNCG